MNSVEQIDELQETLLETIKTKDPKLARRFVVRLKESDERSTKEILQSIEFLAKEMNIRFEGMNIRFEAMQKENNIRFEAMDKRFMQQNRLIGMLFTLLAILIAVLQFATV